MADLHWFPVFVADWLTSDAITLMLPEQEGAFFRLLLRAWGKGASEPSLPADDASLAILSRLGNRWKKLGALVRAQFEERDGKLYNAKLSEVWLEQQTKHERAVARGGKGGKAKAAKAQNSSSSTRAVPEQSEIESLASEPNGSEGQETTAGAAPAPDGAAPSAANAGDSHITPSAREALHRRGIRDEQIDAAPRGNIADHNAGLEFRRTQYDAELTAKATEWMREHPNETAEIGATARIALAYPSEKSSSALTGLQRETLRGAVIEAIRQRCEWPTLDAWDGNEFQMPVGA